MLSSLSGILPEIYMGLSSLFVHKMRSMLTMLGIIFGVGAVVAMLSITEGAKKDILASIEVLGVNNILIEAREAGDGDAADPLSHDADRPVREVEGE